MSGCRRPREARSCPVPLPTPSPAGVVAAEAVLQNPATLSDLFAVRSYVWFWVGRVCNSLAVQVQAIALAWQVYAVARQSASVGEASLAVGMLGLAQFLPMFALTLFAGHAADIYDRRKIMMAGLGVQLVTSALFSAMAYGGLTLLWPIYGVAALFGSARAFYTPASAALAPTLVERRLIPRAIVRQFGGQSDGDHRRPRHRRASGGVFARCGFRRVGRALPRLARLAPAGRVAAAPASSDRLALGADRRRAQLCVDHQGRARRDQPRPVRGSVRRRDGPVAGLCARHPACRAARLRDPARRPVGRRDRHRLRPGRAAAQVACGPEDVRSRRDLRALHLGVRLVALDGLERRGASRFWGRPTWSRCSCARRWCRS